MKYSHTQINKLTIAGVVLFCIWSVFSIMQQDMYYTPDWMDTTGWDIYGVVIIISVYIMVLNFTLLTIRLDSKHIKWHFGVGIPRKTLAIEDIDTVETRRNKWWNGWGIRKVPGGWLYNVYGLDAVEIKTNTGKLIRLGTDEPKKLIRSLESAIAAKQRRA